MEKEINNINPKKATTSNSITPIILKKISGSVLHKLFHESINNNKFSQNL